MSKTTYRMLVRDENGSWNEDGDVTANGTRAARSLYVEGKAFDELTVVAIPLRSWQPKKRRKKTTTIEEDADRAKAPRKAETAATGG